MGARWLSGAGGILAGSLVACAPAHAQTGRVPPSLPKVKPHSSLGQRATGCPLPAKAAFFIEGLHEPVDVESSRTLSEIVQLAERSGWAGNHIPLGFSIAKTGYTLSVTVKATAEADCSERVQVAVSIKLTDRRIEIAKDLAGDLGCAPLARHHYILQAASNDTVLTQFAEELSLVLSRLTLPNLQHDMARADEDRGRIGQVIRAAIDQVWPTLSVAMHAAAEGLDTPDEIAGLVHACLPANGTTPNSQTGTKL